jgi:thiamine-monophosphate kinase
VKVSELGEFGLIRLLAQELGIEYPPPRDALPRRGLLVDLGDDAAVSERRTGAQVLTTDTLVASVHFLPGRTSWEAVGWKALAVNASDIAAMGAEANLALVTLALPPDFEAENASALYKGLQEAAADCGIMICGGDIVKAPVFSITVALSGWAHETELGQPVTMTRSAARAGDIVAVSGFLGNAAAGLALLQTGEAGDSEARRILVQAQERPRPRLAIGREAIGRGVRCAIDISDALLQDLGHVARASGVAIRVEATRLPISAVLEAVFPGRAAGLALTGGEDYELALIASRPLIDQMVRGGTEPITEIGEVLRAPAGKAWVVDETGREISIDLTGWDHLRESNQ